MRSVALILALFSLAVLVGCTSGPELEITSQSTSDTSVLFGDYVVHVQCRVRNTGGEGKVTVTAFVDAVNGSWRKHQNSLIGENETQSFTFDFPEVENRLLGDNSYEYSCGLR